jgi:hypothetical protein
MKQFLLKSKLFAIILIANLFFVGAVCAQTNTWDGSTSNDWNTGSNWSANHVPTSAENVVININAAITVSGSTTINSLTISNSAVVSLTSSGGAARTITIDNNGSAIEAGSSLTLNGSSGSGTRTMGLAFSGANRTMSIAGTLVVTGAGDGTIYSASNSKTTVTGTLKNTGGDITSTASNLTFNSGGTYDHAIDGGTIPTATWNTGSTCLISVNGGSAPNGLAPTNGFANFKWDCATGTSSTSLAGALVKINGDFIVAHTGTSGSLRLVNGPANNNIVLTVGGNFSQTGGTFYIMGTSSSSGSETMDVAGDFSLSGGTLQMSGNSLVGTIRVKGNFSFTGGTITESSSGSGAFIFNGSSTQTFSKTGGTISNTIAFSILNNAIVDFGTSVLDGTNATFNLNSGGTIITANTNGISSSGATGSIQVGGTRTYSTGANYTYNGSAAQITGNGIPNTVHNLTINNTSSTGVTLSKAVSVSGTATFTDGILYTTSSNLLTIASGGSVTGASDASFVDGPVQKIGNTAFDFPIGKANEYHYLHMAATSSSTFTAEYFRATPLSVGAIDPVSSLQQVSMVEYWSFNRNSGSGSPSITIPVTATSHASTMTGLVVAYKAANGWTNLTTTNTPSGTNTGTLATNSAVPGFGFFTVGNITGNAALPVTFGDLRASQAAGGVQLGWTTYSESNVDHFEVERSSNGQSFSEIGQVKAVGNSSSKIDYSLLDASPINGDNFYRVKSVDIDGHITYSSVIKISLGANTNRSVAIYPNPVKGSQLTLQVNNLQKGNYSVLMFNNTGQQVGKFQMNLSNETMTQTLQLPSSLKPGVYNLLLSNGTLKLTKTFIVQ